MSDVNVTEKVARAVEDALMQPTHAPMATHDPRTGDCQGCPWPVHELPPPDVAAEVAPAAVAALSDPEVLAGIAEVLREHGDSRQSAGGFLLVCRCGDAVDDHADHQATALADWLRGQG